MSKTQFLEKAEAVKITIGNVEIVADKREFSTGSFGWYYNGKTTVTVDGKPLSVQVGSESDRRRKQGSGPLGLGTLDRLRALVYTRARGQAWRLFLGHGAGGECVGLETFRGAGYPSRSRCSVVRMFRAAQPAAERWHCPRHRIHMF